MAIRFLTSDLPIIEQALTVYESTVVKEISAAGIDPDSQSAGTLQDGLEHIRRLLSRAREENARRAAGK